MDNDDRPCLRKAILLAPLLYASYLVWKCPCVDKGGCHLNHIMAAMVVELLLLASENKNGVFVTTTKTAK